MLGLLLTSPRMALGGPGVALNVGTLPALPSGPAGCPRRSDENIAKQQTLPAAALCPQPCGALGAVLALRSLWWVVPPGCTTFVPVSTFLLFIGCSHIGIGPP